MIPDGDGARWVCHEAITAAGAIQAPRYLQASDGSWLAYLRDPDQGRGSAAVWTSTDGCTWEAATQLGDRGVLEAAIDPLDPTHWLAVTRDTSDTTALFEQSGGASAEVPEVGEARSVRFARDGTAWVLTASHLHQRPAGGDWTSVALDFEGARIAGLSEDGTRIWLAGAGTEGPRIFEDLGGSWVAVPETDGVFIDGANDGQGGAWFIVNGDRVVHDDGQRVDQRGIGLAWVDDRLWCTSHPEITGWIAGHFTPDEPVPIWVPADLTAPLDCPAGTDVAVTCEPLWPELQERLSSLGASPPDTGFPAGEDEVVLEPRCGCATGEPAPLWLAWLGIALWRRR